MVLPDEPSLGPRRIDGHAACKIAPATQKRYRHCVGIFTSWLLAESYVPCVAQDYDDLALEFKSETLPSKANFEGLLAGLEFVLPRLKGQLVCCRAALAGWNIS